MKRKPRFKVGDVVKIKRGLLKTGANLWIDQIDSSPECLNRCKFIIKENNVELNSRSLRRIKKQILEKGIYEIKQIQGPNVRGFLYYPTFYAPENYLYKIGE
jgi:hypothetical protein